MRFHRFLKRSYYPAPLIFYSIVHMKSSDIWQNKRLIVYRASANLYLLYHNKTAEQVQDINKSKNNKQSSSLIYFYI